MRDQNLTPDQMMDNCNRALVEARRRDQALIAETGDPRDKILTPNQLDAMHNTLMASANRPRELAFAINSARMFKSEIDRFAPIRDKYLAMNKKLAALIPLATADKYTNPQARIECINLCLHYLIYHRCPKCYKVEFEPARVQVNHHSSETAPYCTGCSQVMDNPGFGPAPYPVTIDFNYRERSNPAVQAQIKPYSVYSLLAEIESTTPGPAFDIGGRDLVRGSQTPSYYYSIAQIAKATRQLADKYGSVVSIVNEMSTQVIAA